MTFTKGAVTGASSLPGRQFFYRKFNGLKSVFGSEQGAA